MDKQVFKLNYKDFLKSPLAYIMFICMVGLCVLGGKLLAEKDKENERLMMDKNIEIENLKNCQKEIERRNKILEDIVFQKNIANEINNN